VLTEPFIRALKPAARGKRYGIADAFYPLAPGRPQKTSVCFLTGGTDRIFSPVAIPTAAAPG
jgi:hypothetical protein